MLATLTLLAADGPNNNQLPGDIREFYWGTLAFIVVAALLVKLAGPAIKKGLNGRTQRIQDEFDSAREAKVAAERQLAEASTDLPDVDTEAQRIKGEAVATAAKLKVDIVEKAKVDAEQMKAKAISEIENLSRQAITDLRSEVAGLTRTATEEVVKSELDASAQSDLIDSYISKIGTMA